MQTATSDAVQVANNAPDTSIHAALRVLPKSGTQRARVLSALANKGPMTDDELSDTLHILPNSLRPRRVELVDGGFVQDSGRRKKNRFENECIVWEVTGRGNAGARVLGVRG